MIDTIHNHKDKLSRREPIIEILLATYNGEKYLQAQLDSLLSQTYRNWKLTVRDDGSSDGTMQILEAFRGKYSGNVQILTDAEKNLGSTKNFARLMAASSAPYVMFCDQDDIWLENKIALSMEVMRKLETTHGEGIPLLVFTDLALVDASGKSIAPSFWNMQKLDPSITGSVYKTVAQSTITGCTILANAAAIKRSLPTDVPCFQHDHWLGVCTAYHGRIGYTREATILYRQHGRNEVGLKQPKLTYLWERLRSFWQLWRAWKYIRDERQIKFNLRKALLFKFAFNLNRALKHYTGRR